MLNLQTEEVEGSESVGSTSQFARFFKYSDRFSC